jgi:hypothetical protein
MDLLSTVRARAEKHMPALALPQYRAHEAPVVKHSQRVMYEMGACFSARSCRCADVSTSGEMEVRIPWGT